METKKNNLLSVVEEWKELDKSFRDVEGLQKSCSKAVSNFKKAESDFKKSVSDHVKGVIRISESLKCYRPLSEDEKKEYTDLKKSVNVRKEELNSMSATLPKDNGVYLKIVLGSVNVSLLDEDAKYKYKDEYERFKLVVTIVILVISCINIFTTYRTLDAILHFLFVWYYCTLTIRESILVVNGSRIKGWWRIHHFITTVLAGVLILWHEAESYQYKYQQGCLYRLRALGERYNMDITVDGFHSWMWRGLQFLLPFLILGYCFQLYNAYTLYKLTIQVQDVEWQVPVAALMFLVLFSGNFITTAMTVHQKLNLKELLLRKLQ